MLSFKHFLAERAGNILLFHGTHKKNVSDVKRNGIQGHPTRKGSSEGYVFLSPRSDVAFGYGFMAGEIEYGKNRKKQVPDEDRALVVIEMPKEWYDEHFVKEEGGLLPEISFDSDIPAKFIKTIIIGDRQKVYSYL